MRPATWTAAAATTATLFGLAVYREFGPPDDSGLVFFLGQGCSRYPGTRPSRQGAP
jgi:hypothetical protein